MEAGRAKNCSDWPGTLKAFGVAPTKPPGSGGSLPANADPTPAAYAVTEMFVAVHVVTMVFASQGTKGRPMVAHVAASIAVAKVTPIPPAVFTATTQLNLLVPVLLAQIT